MEQVASISANNDPVIGKLMADAFEKVGKDGVITVEEGKTSETTLDFVEGMQFDKGYISPYFITNPTEMKCELEDCYILIYEKKLSNVRDMLPLLEKVAQSGKPLLIIAEDVESEALAALVVNRLRGVPEGLRGQGAGLRRSPQGDAAATSPSLTGGQFISEDLGLKLENVDAGPARPGQDGARREGKHARSSTAPARRTTSRSASSRSAPRWTRPKASTTRRSSANGWRS